MDLEYHWAAVVVVQYSARQNQWLKRRTERLQQLLKKCFLEQFVILRFVDLCATSNDAMILHVEIKNNADFMIPQHI
ncbi:Ascofuranone/ascochlorin biosynthesis clusters transcription regulator [Dirofilaria immitis]